MDFLEFYSLSTQPFLYLTDHGIYHITRCGIWLLTIFHIPYIYFPRKLRKVIPPKVYLSFFVQYRISTLSINNCQIRLRSAVKTLWERSDPRAEGVQTKDQRRQEYGSCTCLLWGGLDNSLNIIPSALLVRVQHSWKNIYKSIKGLSIRHIVL